MNDLFANMPSPWTALVLDIPTPTLFVDFDGTLHRGKGVIDEHGALSLDTGNKLFEFVPDLMEMLDPYPDVEIVLTTSWLDKLPFDDVIKSLPVELTCRIVGTTQGIKPRFGYLIDGRSRTYVIRTYVINNRLKNWLAIDDSVYGASSLSFPFLDLRPHLVLLDPSQGLGSEDAQTLVRQWLTSVHTTE